jgi:DNA-binding transcriptional regulator YdaS (Cro superfamily)
MNESEIRRENLDFLLRDQGCNQTNFVAKLRSNLRAQGKNDKEIDQLSVSQPTLSDLLSGKIKFSPSHAGKIERAFGLPHNTLSNSAFRNDWLLIQKILSLESINRNRVMEILNQQHKILLARSLKNTE